MSKQRGVLRSVLSMAVPMMSTRFVQTLNTFIAMAIMAQLGHKVLAAGLPISMYRIVVMLAFMSILFVLGPVVGRQMSAHSQKKLPGLLVQSWWLGLLLSLPTMVLYACSGGIMQLFHQPTILIPIISRYYNAFLWAMPGLFLMTVNQQFLAGIKQQNWVTYLSIISLVTNAFLCYGLTLGHFGMPRLGVAGAALSSVISVWFNAGLSFIILLRALPARLQKSDWCIRRPDWMQLIVKVGAPVSMQMTGEMLAIMLMVVFIGWLGEASMAASQIAQQYMLFAIVPVFGLAEAAGIRIGHAIAHNEVKVVKSIGHVSLALGLSVTVLIGFVFLLFHKPLASLFLHQELHNVSLIYHLTMWLLGLRILSMLFDSISDVSCGMLRALYDTRLPMMITLSSNWFIMLPLAYVLGIVFGYGVIGMAVATVVSRSIASLVMLMRWLHKTSDSQLEAVIS